MVLFVIGGAGRARMGIVVRMCDGRATDDDASPSEPFSVQELLLRCLPDLRGFVRLKCGSRLRSLESCSDLVQSIYCEVLERKDRIEGRTEGAFRAWLFKTAERKVLDRARFHRRARRDAGRRQGSDEGSVDDLVSYASLFTPSRVAAAREEVERLERAFDELPESQRDAILWSRLAGLPYAEVARLMGTSEGYARVLVSRGLARLSSLLRPSP